MFPLPSLTSRLRLLSAVLALSQPLLVAQSTPVPSTTPAPQPSAAPASPVAEKPPLAAPRGLVANHDYDGAEQMLRQQLNETPKYGEAHFLLGFTLLHQNHPEQALEEYTRGVQFQQPAPEDLIGAASAHLALHHYADAAAMLETATQRAPKLAIGWYLLGQAQEALGHLVDAEKSYLSCLRIDPHDVRAQYELGEIYARTNRHNEAETSFRAALAAQESLTEKNSQPSLDLGMLLRSQNKAADALPYLKTAVAGQPKNAIAHRELGLAYEKTGNYNEAAVELSKAVELAPQDMALHFYLGRVYRRAGRTWDAQREFEAAARIQTASTTPTAK